MNVNELIILFFIVVGLVWGFWMIFKRDLMQNQLGKLLSYFFGVVVTLLIVIWLAARFLPWWATQLITNTRESPNIQTLQEVGTDLWNEISDPNVNIPIEPTQPPPNNTVPTPTLSPVVTPETSTGQSAPLGGSRLHIVQKGDTLYNLSRRYGTTVEAIKQRNGLTSDTIRIGQTLTIP